VYFVRSLLFRQECARSRKQFRIIWQAGDNFRTSAGTEPRSWFSNASGYQITQGTKVSLAWGMQWTNINMNAFFSQTIGPGPVWELRVREDGRPVAGARARSSRRDCRTRG